MIPHNTVGVDKLDACTDQDLLRHFVQEQDHAAFAALVRRHGALVMGVCRRVLHHAQDTEDAFQASFLVLARKAPSIENYQSLAGWLYKVAYRIALRARANREQRRANENCLLAEKPRSNPDSRSRDIGVLVDDEVQRLPEKYRTPVLLCYLQGQTNEEAAQLLRCPTGTIKIRLLRGREMLRKRLIRQGVALSLVAWLAGEAQAAVPSSLMQATAAAACQLRAGAGLAQLGLSAAVVRLARSWFKRVALAKMKVAGAVLLTVLLLALSDRLAHGALGATAVHVQKSMPAETPAVVPPEYQSPSLPDKRAQEFVFQAGAAEGSGAE